MQTITIIDTETTGLGPEAELLEVAAAIYAISPKCGLVESFSSLFPVSSNPARHVNGIDEGLSAFSSPSDASSILQRMARLSPVFVAFNADFDKRFVTFPNIEWLCAREHIEWYAGWIERPRSQIELALKMGVGVVHAHRAMDDVRTLIACLDRLENPAKTIENAIRRRDSGKRTYVAQVSFADNHLAKEAGFRWNPDRKQWEKQLYAIDEGLLANLAFRTKDVG